jgi:AcrR family transcriptional regulator
MSPTAAERGVQVRRKLLDAAVALIAERGWTAVSTRVVAERAGVAPGLVHYHFSSVQGLLSEAALGAMREVGTMLAPTLAAAGTPAAALTALTSALDPFTGDDPTSVLFTETYLAATRDPALRVAVAEVITEFRARLADWLGAHGVAAPEATAAVVGAAIDGLVLQRALDPALTAGSIAPVLARLVGGQA